MLVTASALAGVWVDKADCAAAMASYTVGADMIDDTGSGLTLVGPSINWSPQ